MFIVIINDHLILFWKRMTLFQSIIEIFKVLAIEIYKFLHGLSPALMGDIMKLNRSPIYNLRIRQELYCRNPKTVKYDTETIAFLAPKLRAIVPQNIKSPTTLSSFKINIRKWKFDCPHRMCECFLKHVGFV